MRRLSLRQQLAAQAGLLVIGLFVVVPLWGLVHLAFDGGIVGQPTEFRIWPEKPTLAVFRQVWERPAQSLSFLGALRNSLLTAGSAAGFAMIFGASLAYSFARLRFPGRQAGLLLVLVGSLLPPVALMTPLYLLLTALKLRTSLLGLALVYAALAMPFCIWNMRAAFQAVPKDLEESAFLDGASHFTAFWRVTLPLALPAIFIAGLVAFLAGYSEFAIGWLFVDRGQNVTLAMAIWGMRMNNFIAWSQLAALAMLMSLPVVAAFLLLQRYLLRGLLVGVPEEP